MCMSTSVRVSVIPIKTYVTSLIGTEFNKEAINDKCFPITTQQAGTWEYNFFKIKHTEEHFSVREIISEIKKDGWQPAKIGHLLEFAKWYVNQEQKKGICVIALGSKVKYSGIPFSPVFNYSINKKCTPPETHSEINIGLHDLYRDSRSKQKILMVKKLTA